MVIHLFKLEGVAHLARYVEIRTTLAIQRLKSCKWPPSPYLLRPPSQSSSFILTMRYFRVKTQEWRSGQIRYHIR